MTTMVTGGTGLVGSAIEANIKLNSKDADLKSWEHTKAIFTKNKPTKVIHCAAKVGGLGGNMLLKGEFFLDNVLINANVIEACRLFEVQKLVCFLSTCIFPDSVVYPLTEKKIHAGPPHSSNYAYAYAKRMVDVQLRSYREQYGLKYVSVVPTNIYGPRDNFNLENGHVIPSLIHKCFLAKRDNKDFEVWGSGRPLREFIFSEDIAALTEWAIDNYDEEEPIIFSTSKEISIKQVASIIADAMKFKGTTVFQTEKPDGQMRKPSDNSKLLAFLPDFEFTSIQEGIHKTVDWFIKNYEAAKK